MTESLLVARRGRGSGVTASPRLPPRGDCANRPPPRPSHLPSPLGLLRAVGTGAEAPAAGVSGRPLLTPGGLLLISQRHRQ